VTERSYGTYLRRFALPFDADPSAVAASFDKGVLAIHVPRPPETAPKTTKIAIKGS
jgi:HSP20 family protein